MSYATGSYTVFHHRSIAIKVLECFEEGLRHGGFGAVVAEVARLSMTAFRHSVARERRGHCCQTG